MHVSLVISSTITRQGQYLLCVWHRLPWIAGPIPSACCVFPPVLPSSYPGVLPSLCFSWTRSAFPSFLLARGPVPLSPRSWSRAVCPAVHIWTLECSTGGGSWAGTGCSQCLCLRPCLSRVRCPSSGELSELQHRDTGMVSRNLISFLSTRLNNVTAAGIWCVNAHLRVSVS